MTLHVGVTGTRYGCTLAQLSWLNTQLSSLDFTSSNSTPIVLHHGDCIGVDEETYGLAHERGWLTHAHPPDNPKWRAHTRPNNWTDEPLPYHTRDYVMVDSVRVLLAVPRASIKSLPRSGTWLTVRYALTRPGIDIRIAPWES